MEDNITICTHGCDNEFCEHTPVRMLGDGTEYRTEDLYGTEECPEKEGYHGNGNTESQIPCGY